MWRREHVFKVSPVSAAATYGSVSPLALKNVGATLASILLFDLA